MNNRHFHPKNIIMCSDGTGNTMAKGRGSNVWKLYESLDLSRDNPDTRNDDNRRQLAFYDDGVGTESFKLFKILGGAFGWGLQRNVCQLYASLCRAYRCDPDVAEDAHDCIYLFGFSRGAYTVRTLAGLITSCGILKDAGTMTDRQLMDKIDDAYEVFRGHFKLFTREGKGEISTDVMEASEQFRKDNSHDVGKTHSPPIEFIGVWDTVAAVGLPFKEITDAWNFCIYPFKFPDLKLHPQVKRACHALAIDDERRTFHPILWNEEEEKDKSRIEQVWFSGMHSNVGGGYPRHGMSLIPLNWMIQKSQAAGLRFDEALVSNYRNHENIHDKMYDSRALLGLFYRYEPRDITAMCGKQDVELKFYSSVNERISLSTQGYAPGNVAPARLEDHHEELRGLKEPMKSARILIKVRRSLHWALVLLVLFIAGVLITAYCGGLKGSVYVPEKMSCYTDKVLSYVPIARKPLQFFFNVLYSNAWFALIVLIVIFIILVASRVVRGKQKKVYNDYWSDKRVSLGTCIHYHSDQKPHTHT